SLVIIIARLATCVCGVRQGEGAEGANRGPRRCAAASGRRRATSPSCGARWARAGGGGGGGGGGRGRGAWPPRPACTLHASRLPAAPQRLIEENIVDNISVRECSK
ncbi:Protein of unknown function, partial [Gryllus bimaculatus]